MSFELRALYQNKPLSNDSFIEVVQLVSTIFKGNLQLFFPDDKSFRNQARSSQLTARSFLNLFISPF